MLRNNKLFAVTVLSTLFCFTSLCFAGSYDLRLAVLNLEISNFQNRADGLNDTQLTGTENNNDDQIINIWKAEIKHHNRRVKTGKIMVLGAGIVNIVSPFIAGASSDDDQCGTPELATFVYVNLATVPVYVLGLTNWIGGHYKVKKLDKIGKEKGWIL
ncbi:MAG: hypothetical protein A2161_08355 [Candidatus Schekmanbacteria bacterium RBG_13_48_7]|uniref:Uncharacterized protein n=1 Tax=Candidatus Schekmanbacteria bacterium RBG_13_48_7 TaxID=1817878 RepID=A0A1F7S6B2_9BACT|nr:MAG: hypothetical protein A2161_08355 [Candidatus Schekmanbacteria bacterium RBG_13_48_7]